MTVPLWASELASAFWARAGEAEPFPRNLRRPIARAVPLAIIYLPKLTVATVRQWLHDSGVVCELGTRDRPLRACLVGRNGHGFAFVDGADPEAEQRFSLAHELAHFLRDYWHPRLEASKRLGPAILEVFDGERPPNHEERIHALLRTATLGMHVHLLERNAEGEPATTDIADAEDNADRLAYELLAPAAEVWSVAGASGDTDRRALEKILVATFGLPERQAAAYAHVLLPMPFNDPLLLRLKALSGQLE